MLQHRDNIDYPQDTGISMDAELDELVALLKANDRDEAEAIYQGIRKLVLRDIKYRELAVTVVLKDLREIRDRSPTHYAVVEEFIIHNDLSYKQIADVFGVSAQRVYIILREEAQMFPWIKNLVKIKSAEDAVNSNNKTRFFPPKRLGVFHGSVQTLLFDWK